MKKLAFKNKENEIVRIIEFTEQKLIISLNKLTKRLEFITQKNFDPKFHKLVKEVQISELNQKPQSLGKYGSLCIYTDDKVFSQTPIIRFDKPYAVKRYLKPVAIGQALVLLLCFSILFFTTKEDKELKTNVRLFKVTHIKKVKQKIVKLKIKKQLKSGISNKLKKKSKKTPKRKRLLSRNNKVKKTNFKSKKRYNKARRTAYTKNKSKISKFKSKKRGVVYVRKVRRTKRSTARKSKNSLASSGILGLLGSSKSGSRHLRKGGFASNTKKGRGNINNLSEYDGLLSKTKHRAQSGNTLIKVATKGTGGGNTGYGKSNVKISGGYIGNPYALGNYAQVYGGLDKSQIEEVIRRHRGQLVYCYESSLQVKPNLNGRVDVKFIIGGTGRVSSANVKATTLKSKNVENCLISKLKKWKFPTPVGNVKVKVSYPFSFNRPGTNKKNTKERL